jgi:predicted nucleic acid-binding protein
VWLVDTSAWVELFRRPARLTLGDLAEDASLIVTCLPVIQEVLQGFDDDRAFGIARASMSAWHAVDTPMPAATVERAVDIYRRACRAGVTIRSSVDCLIAASALEHGLTLVHCDRDYPAIARITGLRHIDLSSRLRH